MLLRAEEQPDGGLADHLAGTVAEHALQRRVAPDGVAVAHAHHADQVVLQHRVLLARQLRQRLPRAAFAAVDAVDQPRGGGQRQRHQRRQQRLPHDLGAPARQEVVAAHAGEQRHRIPRHLAVGGDAVDLVDRRRRDVDAAFGVLLERALRLLRQRPRPKALGRIGFAGGVARHQVHRLRAQRHRAGRAQGHAAEAVDEVLGGHDGIDDAVEVAVVVDQAAGQDDAPVVLGAAVQRLGDHHRVGRAGLREIGAVAHVEGPLARHQADGDGAVDVGDTQRGDLRQQAALLLQQLGDHRRLVRRLARAAVAQRDRGQRVVGVAQLGVDLHGHVLRQVLDHVAGAVGLGRAVAPEAQRRHPDQRDDHQQIADHQPGRHGAARRPGQPGQRRQRNAGQRHCEFHGGSSLVVRSRGLSRRRRRGGRRWSGRAWGRWPRRACTARAGR